MNATYIPYLAGEANLPQNLARDEHPESRIGGHAVWGLGEVSGLPHSGESSELWLYRERTVGLLRRYMRLSVEVGRLPSLLGREFFRTRVTSYHVSTFEDVVIFVHDVEHGLEQLDRFEQQLIARIVLQEYSQWEAARLLHCGLRTVERCFPDALDALSRIFLRGGILERMVGTETRSAKTCQEGEMEENPASYCIDGE